MGEDYSNTIGMESIGTQMELELTFLNLQNRFNITSFSLATTRVLPPFLRFTYKRNLIREKEEEEEEEDIGIEEVFCRAKWKIEYG